MFDVGVYLVVVGIACKIIFVLAKSTQRLRALVAEEEARYSSPVEQPHRRSHDRGPRRIQHSNPERRVMQLETALLVGVMFTVATYLVLQRSFVKILFGFVILSNAANLRRARHVRPPGRQERPRWCSTPTRRWSTRCRRRSILTAIVIGFGVTAYLVFLLYRLFLDQRPPTRRNSTPNEPANRHALHELADRTHPAAAPHGGGRPVLGTARRRRAAGSWRCRRRRNSAVALLARRTRRSPDEHVRARPGRLVRRSSASCWWWICSRR